MSVKHENPKTIEPLDNQWVRVAGATLLVLAAVALIGLLAMAAFDGAQMSGEYHELHGGRQASHVGAVLIFSLGGGSIAGLLVAAATRLVGLRVQLLWILVATVVLTGTVTTVAGVMGNRQGAENAASTFAACSPYDTELLQEVSRTVGVSEGSRVRPSDGKCVMPNTAISDRGRSNDWIVEAMTHDGWTAVNVDTNLLVFERDGDEVYVVTRHNLDSTWFDFVVEP